MYDCMIFLALVVKAAIFILKQNVHIRKIKNKIQ